MDIKSGIPAPDQCAIKGCGRRSTRACRWCTKPLCDECWCHDEIDSARKELEERENTLRRPR